MNRHPLLRALTATLLLLPLSAAPLAAQEQEVPTRVMVRAVARDAKIIGSGVGGALIRIVNAATGEVLAEGKQEGGTGSTQLIMSTPHTRGMTVYDTEGAAGFLAELQLVQPTVVNISAVGPLGYPQAIRSATAQVLLVPGGHIEGDGVILELRGFIVEILKPAPLDPVAYSFDVAARVRMMCGCTIEPGGMWDANTKTLVAVLRADGVALASTVLAYAGQTSMFEGTLSVPTGAEGKELQLEVLVSEASRENFGRHSFPMGELETEGERSAGSNR